MYASVAKWYGNGLLTRIPWVRIPSGSRIHLGFQYVCKYYLKFGVLAQLGEHLPYKQRVIGSSPIGPIFRQYMPMWLNWQSS